MNTYNSKLQTNNTTIQELIDLANSLPEAGSDLDTLDNPGTAEDLMANKELLDAEGKKVTGTFSLDSELATNTDLISQITTALEGKAAGGGSTVEICAVTIACSDNIKDVVKNSRFVYTTLIDGEICMGWTDGTSVIENGINVIKNTALIISSSDYLYSSINAFSGECFDDIDSLIGNSTYSLKIIQDGTITIN